MGWMFAVLLSAYQDFCFYSSSLGHPANPHCSSDAKRYAPRALAFGSEVVFGC